jgi:hypothetical protein
MLEGLRITAGSVSMLIGVALVYDAVWNPGPNQTAFLLGGRRTSFTEFGQHVVRRERLDGISEISKEPPPIRSRA